MLGNSNYANRTAEEEDFRIRMHDTSVHRSAHYYYFTTL